MQTAISNNTKDIVNKTDYFMINLMLKESFFLILTFLREGKIILARSYDQTLVSELSPLPARHTRN